MIETIKEQQYEQTPEQNHRLYEAIRNGCTDLIQKKVNSDVNSLVLKDELGRGVALKIY